MVLPGTAECVGLLTLGIGKGGGGGGGGDGRRGLGRRQGVEEGRDLVRDRGQA